MCRMDYFKKRMFSLWRISLVILNFNFMIPNSFNYDLERMVNFFFLTVQIVHGLGTFNLYKKAGYSPIFSFIPIYNGLVLL